MWNLNNKIKAKEWMEGVKDNMKKKRIEERYD